MDKAIKKIMDIIVQLQNAISFQQNSFMSADVVIYLIVPTVPYWRDVS